MNGVSPNLPCSSSLQNTILEFKKSLQVSDEEAHSIERSTVLQKDSPLWFRVRKYRITASVFGDVMHRRADTPPDKLVLRILEQKQFQSPATQWGLDNESRAVEEYQKHQIANGHSELIVSSSGFIICKSHPFLGATPDGTVYDPASAEPYGIFEIKSPYSQRNKTPREACDSPGFYCNVNNGGIISLRKNHSYYCQVQGQMAISERSWCDFVIYTTKEINIQRIPFEPTFWNNELLPKLIEFYDKCMAPEIVSPMHALGLPMRDLRK